MTYHATGYTQSREMQTSGQRVIKTAARRAPSTYLQRTPDCPLGVTGIVRRGVALNSLLGSFVQDERLPLRGLPFSVFLAGIVGFLVGDAEGRV